MYNSIEMNQRVESTNVALIESLSMFNQSASEDESNLTNWDQLYQEAVFADGKQSLEKFESQCGVVKKLLMDEISKQENSTDDKKYEFNPKSYWKHYEFKQLENVIQKTFGFRSVTIQPYIEKYISKDKQFESAQINCITYSWDRFPIDGLVTDKGFFDNTHSINLDIGISLGLIKLLDADEMVAVLLHEIGHNVDPALVSISYARTNIISKYLTDRSSELNKGEKKLVNSGKKNIFTISVATLLTITGIVASVIGALALIVASTINFIRDKKSTKNAGNSSEDITPLNKGMMKKLQDLIKDDAKTEFNRKDYAEAFADNFARMYGYGTALSKAFKKLSKSNEEMINSRIKKEKLRQRCIMTIVSNSLKNVHKTDVHRIKALIASYYEDINDPNTPEQVRKQLSEDVKEVEEILKSFMNDFSDFQNKINKMISDEIDAENELRKVNDSNDEVTESHVDGVEYFDESKKAYDELMRRSKTVTSAERTEFYKLFGHSKKCTLANDKDGYYVYTHRCRSKSYPSIKDIPVKDVEFVRSTS